MSREGDAMSEDPRRRLPAVQAVLEALRLPANRLYVHLVEEELGRERSFLKERPELAEAWSREAFIDRVGQRMGKEGPGFLPVFNLTGVVLHTNLGRAPLAPAALQAVLEAAGGYTDLEIDMETGERTSRLRHTHTYLKLLTGAEASLVVNNNAAGIFLALLALARGKEVIISRGELVEIGESFRIPDIMASAGVILREVGATNRTRLQDYEQAVSPETVAIMKVHPSNFRQVGFVESTPLEALRKLSDERGLLLLDDVGSGSLLPLPGDEPTVSERIRAGSDLVFFSGDKLLGGPQAGIVAGRADLVQILRRHPLYRALRPDKMTLAALRATFQVSLLAPDSLPVRAMILAKPDDLRRRAGRLRARLVRQGVKADVVERDGVSGGGSLPEFPLKGWALRLDPGSDGADSQRRRLRTGSRPLLALVEDGMIILDVRTLPDDLVEEAARAVADVFGPKRGDPS